MATLYELSNDWQLLMNLATSGEIDEEVLQDTLDSMSYAIDEKAEGYAVVDLELQAQEEKLKKEIRRLQERKTSITKNRKSLKESLRDEMLAMGKEKIKTDKFTIHIQNNPPKLVVEDESEIPKAYWEPQAPKLNKRLLLQDLKDEEYPDFKGARVVQERSLRIR